MLKQAVASLLAHFLNIILGVLFASSSGLDADECAWYAVNFTFDVVIGGAMCIVLLRISEWLASSGTLCTDGFSALIKKSGAYPVEEHFKAWLAQLVIWLAIMSLSKVVLGAFLFLLRKPIDEHFAVPVFEPIQNHPESELLIVMIVWPLVLNAIYFWVIDLFIKADDEKYDFSNGCCGCGAISSEDNDAGETVDDNIKPEVDLVAKGGVVTPVASPLAAPLLVNADGALHMM